MNAASIINSISNSTLQVTAHQYVNVFAESNKYCSKHVKLPSAPSWMKDLVQILQR